MKFRRLLYFAITSTIFKIVLAQTPSDFQPGTNVRLGVSFPGQNISPAGTLVNSLEEVMSAPNVKIPASALQQANNGSNSLATDQSATRFAVFMIDIDAVAGGKSTTLLHWFQSDLIPQGKVQARIPSNTSKFQSSEASLQAGHPLVPRELSISPSPSGQSSISTMPQPRLEAPYLPPSPPPGAPHRYVLALYVQLANYSFPACYSDVAVPMNSTSMKNETMITINVRARLGFNVDVFAKAAGLVPIPVAGNFFRAGTDIGNAKRRNIWERRANAVSENAAQTTTRSISFRSVDCAATTAPTTKEPPVATTIFVTKTATTTKTQTTTLATETVLVTASSKVRETRISSLMTESEKPAATGKGIAS